MDSYSPISNKTWEALKAICKFKHIAKGSVLYKSETLLDSFSFVYSGLFRVFITDKDGNEYNKNFFDAGSFPGSMAALLTATPSRFTIESLEDSLIIVIDFNAYRRLLLQANSLKLFHIFYLEKNWLLAKDAREVELVQEDAAQRYQRFLSEYPSISARIPQYHIASHLGITPTQLSRIRNKN
jgi:CRP-like cAMP-binding protein